MIQMSKKKLDLNLSLDLDVIPEYQVEEYQVVDYISEINRLLKLDEMSEADVETIEKKFKEKTGIYNKKDMTVLVIGTVILSVKGILYPEFAVMKGFGQSIDKSKRLAHNDKKIEDSHRKANDNFRDKNIEKRGTGQWINLIYQSVPYDITKGSTNIGVNMEGRYHRIHTLGHDPILGWLFGTANILTDTITFDDFSTYRIRRKPMMITDERVLMPLLFKECYDSVSEEWMRLPAAIFAQWQHLLSDKYTIQGLPIPVLETIVPELAGKLYKEQYDALCLKRDLKIIEESADINILLNMIVGLVHGVQYNEKTDENKELYEVRTRKILSISNAIGSSSNIIRTVIEKKPQDLDIGGLLITISNLVANHKFMAKVKQEYIDSEMNKSNL